MRIVPLILIIIAATMACAEYGTGDPAPDPSPYEEYNITSTMDYIISGDSVHATGILQVRDRYGRIVNYAIIMLHVPRGFATASRTDGAGNSSVVWDFESSPSALLQLEACASNFGSSRCDTYEAVLTIQT